jgi:hypothetical protein
MAQMYTVFRNGELVVKCIDDMRSAEDWAYGGMIFTSRENAVDCIRDRRRYEDYSGHNVVWEIKELFIKNHDDNKN